MRKTQLAIIGAGPAGLAAALEASKAGLAVTILDENTKPGGQIFRQFEDGFSLTDPEMLGRDYRRGQEFLKEFEKIAHKIEYIPRAAVWGIFDNRLAYQDGKKSAGLGFERLLIAAGAYDRPVPLPGWTLPGVMTAGGAQRIVKMNRILPGSKILLAGTGPMQLVLADQIIAAGGRIAAILEAGDINWLSFLPGLWRQWDYLGDGLRYLRHLWQARVPLWRNHILLEARGDGHVEEALLAEVDRNWRPKLHTRRAVKVDCVCLGYGLVPSVELTLLAGCDHQYEPKLGGWVPRRNRFLETSVPGLYAAGDGSGVAGSKVALEEGRLVGIETACSLGHLSDAEAQERLGVIQKRLKRLRRFCDLLYEISRPRPGLYELARKDTIICRCEEITLAEIEEALADNASNINEIKRMTRSGMGRCQGRMCGPALYELLSRKQGSQPEGLGAFQPRPPVKPVSLEVLAGGPAAAA
ncbi:MAG: NAD(P)/FAD-dependent oxidoreductase [Thermodesulfobacteriota bacterium]